MRLFTAFVALMLLTAPMELHGDLLQVSGLRSDGTVSVDAQHSEQDPHFEHSRIELRSACLACLSTEHTKVTLLIPRSQQPKSPGSDRLASAGHCRPLDDLGCIAHSRAPPLL